MQVGLGASEDGFSLDAHSLDVLDLPPQVLDVVEALYAHLRELRGVELHEALPVNVVSLKCSSAIEGVGRSGEIRSGVGPGAGAGRRKDSEQELVIGRESPGFLTHTASSPSSK